MSPSSFFFVPLHQNIRCSIAVPCTFFFFSCRAQKKNVSILCVIIRFVSSTYSLSPSHTHSKRREKKCKFVAKYSARLIASIVRKCVSCIFIRGSHLQGNDVTHSLIVYRFQLKIDVLASAQISTSYESFCCIIIITSIVYNIFLSDCTLSLLILSVHT